MDNAGISGFQGHRLREEAGFAVPAWQKQCSGEQQLFLPSQWVSSTVHICWSQWMGGLTGAQEADPSVVHASVSQCWKTGGLFSTPRGLKTLECGAVYRDLQPYPAHVKRSEVFPQWLSQPLLDIQVNYFEWREGLNTSLHIFLFETPVMLEKKG